MSALDRPISSTRIVPPRVLALITTYKCTAACSDCCFDCTPKRSERISAADMIATIDAAFALGSIRTVVFSGGECFINFEDLVGAVKHATSLGLGTRCVTNGFWAKSSARGRIQIERIAEAGLTELNVSTGDQHLKFVPMAAVENAAVLGVGANLTTRLVVEESAARVVTADDYRSRPRMAALLSAPPRADGTRLFDLLESPWMPMDAERSIASSRTLDRSKLPACKGCSSIFTTIVRSPDNKLGICCGLSRSLIPELNTPFDADHLRQTLSEAAEDFVKIWIFVDGPEKIIAWAAGHDPTIAWEGRYAHHCHVCLAIYKDPKVKRVIVDHYAERVDDVLMRFRLMTQVVDTPWKAEPLGSIA